MQPVKQLSFVELFLRFFFTLFDDSNWGLEQLPQNYHHEVGEGCLIRFL